MIMGMITMIIEIKVVIVMIVMRRARVVYSPFRSLASEAPLYLGLQVNLILHQLVLTFTLQWVQKSKNQNYFVSSVTRRSRSDASHSLTE